MSLVATIRADSLVARKARDSPKATFLITLLGETEIVGKNAGNRETTDAETLAVIQKFAKNANEVLKVRPGDAAAVYELGVLQGYLPSKLTGAALGAAIDQAVADAGLTEVTGKDIGMVMKALAAKHAGAYDGAEASAAIRARVQLS